MSLIMIRCDMMVWNQWNRWGKSNKNLFHNIFLCWTVFLRSSN